jgi:Putative phage tail protein
LLCSQAQGNVISSISVTVAEAGSPGGGSEIFTVGATSAPYAWGPTTTPIYSLGEDDFIVQESSVGSYLGVTPGGPALRMGAGPITGGFTDDPVHITRTTPADAMNMVQLETTDRGMSYNTSVAEAFDQGAIDRYGVRRDTSVKARAIVDPYYVAATAAQLVLQRQILYRNTYSFQLGWKYILLEPMDLVQITDPYLGAAAITVRITSVEEDDEGTLSITCEDWFGVAGAVMYPPAATVAPAGAEGGGSQFPLVTPLSSISVLGSGGATAMPYPIQSHAAEAAAPNYGQTAPSVNPPFIFEPTAQLLAARSLVSPYVVIGLSGGPNSAYSANWGGAVIYVSLDGDTFAPLGELSGRSTMGYTTADCGAAGTTLSVDLTESGGQLGSVSAQVAASGVSLCAVRTPAGTLEFVSYTTATLTGPNRYNLTGLYRGLYGTFAVDLPLGSQFLSLGSGAVFEEVLPAQLVGRALYFEFPSYNPVGGGAQLLSETIIYTYTPLGSSVVPGLFPVAVVKENRMPVESGETARRDGSHPLESH